MSGDVDSKTYVDLEAKAGKLKSTDGGQLKLLNPSDAVSRVMKTLGFDKYFDIRSSLDEAVKAF